MEAIVQSPDELGFYYAHGPIDESCLTIISETTVKIRNFEMRMCIIGESHLLQIAKDGNVLMTEVVACVDLDTKHLAQYRSLEDVAQASLDLKHSTSDFSYEISIEGSRVGKMPQSYEKGSTVTFPMTHGVEPFTSMCHRIERFPTTFSPKGTFAFIFLTLHTYPSEGGFVDVVSTLSRIQLTDSKRRVE